MIAHCLGVGDRHILARNCPCGVQRPTHKPQSIVLSAWLCNHAAAFCWCIGETLWTYQGLS